MSGVLPENLARAAPSPEEFDLSKVKHVVYVMQENRSFDHYFGTFPGVRGFDDPDAMTLPNGNSVFMQPDPANPDGYLLPFHMDTDDHRSRRASRRSRTTGATSTRRGTRARWTAG